MKPPAPHTSGSARSATGPAWVGWAKAHRSRLILGACLATVLLVVGGLLGYLQPHTWRYYTDGVSVRRLAKDTEPRPVLWEDARALPCNPKLPADASEPFVLADGVTMLFSSGGAAGDSNLFRCRWTGSEWTDPAPLPALNSAFHERGPVVSPDGQQLFFSSDRPGGLGGYDIWVARWDGLTWAWPANLGYMINTKFDEVEPAVSPFDGRLFFSSDRAKRRLTDEEDALPVKELRQRFKGGDFDLYAADQVPADAAVNREIERMQSQLYSLRSGALGDPAVMRKLGGSDETEAAVARALAWLAANQESDGSWSLAKHEGTRGHDAAGTGFALLTFLGRGVKPDDGSPHGGTVSKALKWLVDNAKLNGDMRVGGNMYDQGIATLALTEAYGLTKDEKLKDPVQAAVNFIVDAQHEDGGWRYTPKEAGDLSVSGWQIMALKSAELSGLVISETCLAKARAWLREKMVSGPHGGIYGYTANGAAGPPAMQAAGFFCSQLLGISPNSARARDSVAALVKHGFTPGKADIYYWYNAVLGSYQYQGPLWQEWNKHLIEHYLPSQRRDGDLAGSWDPAGHQHGNQMGRVIVTAMCTLSLEVYYRYTPLYGLGYNPQAAAASADGWDADRICKVPLYRRARPVDALNSPAEEQRPSFTRRGDFVYFASNRDGGAGGFDIYRARVNQATEGSPERLGPEVNTTADETAPATRLGGFQLLFASNRAGGRADAPRWYAATSRHVRAVHDYTQTRGMADQLRAARGRLGLLAVAFVSALIFWRRFRRSAVEDRVGAAAMVASPAGTGDLPRFGRRRPGRALARVGLTLSLLAVAGLLGSVFLALRTTVWCRYTDDVSIIRQAVDVTPRPVVWDEPAPSSRQTGNLADRSALQLTPDGGGLFLSRPSAAPPGKVQILTSTWDGYQWSNPAPVEGLSGEWNARDAVVTRDGERMFFASDQPGGLGGYDLWTAVRVDGKWGKATHLGPAVNTPGDELAPAPSPDGKRLFFSSNNTTRTPRDFDLFAATISSGAAAGGAAASLQLSPAAPLAALNSPANEMNCSFSERGDWLYFASDRGRGGGRFDLYSARVLDQHVGQVVNLGTEINTAADEQGPAAGMEGFQLVFGSDRGTGGSASTRLFSADGCEVMGRWDFSRWFSLGNLLHSLRWWIALFVAALAAILYILTHLRDITSLRSKCIIASVLIHLVLLLLTSLWIISSQFLESRASRNQELSVNIDALAQEKLALDVRETVMELPQSKVTIMAEQAEETLPLPDFKPVQRAVQTVVARSVVESFVAESVPAAGTPETRTTPAPKLPVLPEIQPPKLDVILKVENPLITTAEVKAAEAFQPLVNVPAASTARVEVALPVPKPLPTSTGVAAVTKPAPLDPTAASLIRDTGGKTPVASKGGEVSAGLTNLTGPGAKLTAQLAGGNGNRLAPNLPGKLDVPDGLAREISPYKLRQEAKENVAYLEGLGGSSATQGAVDKALDWLTRHQEPDGRWSIDKHGGKAGHDVAASGLAFLCYMGWGAKHNAPGPYQQPAAKALAWLCAQAKPNGDIRGAGGDMYDQGIAGIALAEAFALTKDESLRPVVAKVVDFIVKAQHRETGGWRYQPGQPGDTSVFGWQLMALLSARMSGIEVPQETVTLAESWLTRVGGGQHGGLYGYENKSPKPAMAAEGMFCRQIMGVAADDPRMVETAAFLTADPPQANKVDMYYCYYGTLAMYQHRGPAWDKWNEQLKTVLPPLQATTGDDAGSWGPHGGHGGQMGRVVSTAMATLSLEVYYRYLPFAFAKGTGNTAAPPPANGAAPPPGGRSN